MSDALDCTGCGACCVSPFDGVGYISLSPDEEDLLRRLSLPVIELDIAPGERLALLGTHINRQGLRVCRALSGEVGRQVACTVYESRPLHCRQFEAGSPECLAARVAAGLGRKGCAASGTA